MISALLAIVAVLAVYGHFTVLHGVSAFLILLIAYVVLLLGNLLRVWVLSIAWPTCALRRSPAVARDKKW